MTRPMDKRALVVLGIVFGGLFLVFFAFLFLAMTAMKGPAALATGPKIGVIEIQDVIRDSQKTLEDLKRFREDDAIEAVLVRIDSPGGAVGPSQEIHDAILETRKKKHVIASLGGTAASGGFYIAVACEKIVTNPGTLTGSIGVIMQFPNVQGLAQWAKVDMETVKSGKFKDVGNPFRPFGEEDEALLHDLIMNVYDQFLTAVAEGRGLEKDAVRPYADGRVLTGLQAKDIGLVDELGNFDHAVATLAELAEIKGEPQLVYPEKTQEELLRDLLSQGAKSVAGGVRQEIGKAALEAGLPSVWLLAGTP